MNIKFLATAVILASIVFSAPVSAQIKKDGYTVTTEKTSFGTIEKYVDQNGVLKKTVSYNENGIKIQEAIITDEGTKTTEYDSKGPIVTSDWPIINNRTILPKNMEGAYVPDWAVLSDPTNNKPKDQDNNEANSEDGEKPTGSHFFLTLIITSKGSSDLERYKLAEQLMKKVESAAIPEKKRKLLLQLEQTLGDINSVSLNKAQFDKYQEMATYLTKKQQELFPETYVVSKDAVRASLNKALGLDKSYESIEELMDNLVTRTTGREKGDYTALEMEAYVNSYYYLIQRAEALGSDKGDAFALHALLMGAYIIEFCGDKINQISIDRSVFSNFLTRLTYITVNLSQGSKVKDLIEYEAKTLKELKGLIRK